MNNVASMLQEMNAGLDIKEQLYSRPVILSSLGNTMYSGGSTSGIINTLPVLSSLLQ